MASDPQLQPPAHDTKWWEKIDQLLQTAIERPPSEQSAFLREACAGDDFLLAEVQSLLSAHHQASDFIDHPPLEGALRELEKPRNLEGIRIGPYDVQSLLGSGGMGEVYKARDTRLNRAVAIKFLSPAVSVGVRLQYFEREARLASSLNHPNIVTIYDVGSSEFGPYFAMELVEGKTLREILADGPLPIKRVLSFASQVADGLAKAHAAGIFHRDLKPENLMVTADGLAKILDFGLAKVTPPASGPEPGPERLSKVTDPGMILGTVGYMSPEQASGLPVDFRTDQFSLGAILYEMVTGKRAFERGTSIETLSAVIRDEPASIVSLNPKTPAPCRWVIERCLSKRTEDRYASTFDLAAELRNLRDHLQDIFAVEVSQPTRGASKPKKSRVLLWAGVLGLILAAALTASWFLIASAGGPVTRLITFGNGHISHGRFAPDGRSVIYGASWDGQEPQVYMAEPGNPESRPLHLKSAGIWAVSPKGEVAIAHPCRLSWGVCLGKLALAPIGGTEEPREILANVTSADWSADGKRLIAAQYSWTGGRIIEYPSMQVLYTTSMGWISDVRVLPDNQIAFIEHPNFEDLRGSVCVLDREKKCRVLSKNWRKVSGMAWHPVTKEIWFSGSRGAHGLESELYAVTLDGDDERRVYAAPTGVWINDISQDGRQVLMRRFSPRATTIVLAPGESKERILSHHDYSTVADFSSDGKVLLFYEWGEAVRGVFTAFLRGTDGSSRPRSLNEGKPLALSADRRWVLARQDTQPPQLVLLPTGFGQRKVLPRGDIVEFSGWAAWTPDPNRIVFSTIAPNGRGRTYVQDIDQGLPVAVTDPGITGVLLSRDGNWIAAFDRLGEYFLYPMDGGDDPTPLYGYKEGDKLLQWADDGRAIFLRDSSDDRLNIYKLDIRTSARTHWKTLTPPYSVGLVGIGAGPGQVQITRDGLSYAYTFWTAPSELYVIEGLR